MKKVTQVITPHVHYTDGSILNKITTNNEAAALDLIAADSEEEGFSHGTLTIVYMVVDVPDPNVAIQKAAEATAAALLLTEQAAAAKVQADEEAAAKLLADNAAKEV